MMRHAHTLTRHALPVFAMPTVAAITLGVTFAVSLAPASPARAQAHVLAPAPAPAKAQGVAKAEVRIATTGQAKILSRCVVVVDVASGDRIHENGDCAVRQGPESSFKIPLALMGFETGILRDGIDPAWTYDGSFPAPERDRKTVDPTSWERDSVVWYSRALVKRMAKQDGDDVLGKWLERLDYGNRDASGDPGKNNGLTQAWLSSSIQISPQEQTRFLRRLVTGDLPVSARSMQLTRGIIPVFNAADGWTIHGKTGSTGRKPVQTAGATDAAWQERGWFVGWAEKAGRQLVFAVHEHTQGAAAAPLAEPLAGPRLRTWTLAHFSELAR